MKRNGSSLIEIVVVLAIGAALWALMFGGRSMAMNRSLIGATRNLLSDIRLVEQNARTERTCWRIVFDRADDSWSIDKYIGTVQSAPVGGGNQCQDALLWFVAAAKSDASDVVSRRLPSSVDLTSTTLPNDTLVFSPLGMLDLGGPLSATVQLQTDAGQVRVVQVNTTGRVVILP